MSKRLHGSALEEALLSDQPLVSTETGIQGYEEEKKEDDDVSTLMAAKQIFKDALRIIPTFAPTFVLLATFIESGRLNSDPDHIAATTLITLLANTESGIAFGQLFSIGILNSRAFGEHEALEERLADSKEENAGNQEKMRLTIERVRNYNKNGTLVALGVAAFPMLTLYYTKEILVFLGQNPKVAEIAADYLKVFAAATPGWGWGVANNQILLSCRKPQLPGMIGIITFLMSLALSIVLSFPFGAGLGLRGIALGFLLEAYGTPIADTACLLWNKDLQKFEFFRHWTFNREDWLQMKEILSTAFPILLSFVSEFGIGAVVALLMGNLGRDELAAQNCITQLFFLILVMQFAFAQATANEFGRALGAKCYENASRYAKGGLLSGLGVALPLTLAVALYPEMMAWITTGSNRIIHEKWFDLVHTLAPISAGGMLLDLAGLNMLQVLRTTGDNAKASFISVASLWLGVLAAYILGFQAGFGAMGVAAGNTGGLFLRAAILGYRWIGAIQPEVLEANANRPPPAPPVQIDSTAEAEPRAQRFGERCCNLLSACWSKRNSHTILEEVVDGGVDEQKTLTLNVT